MIHSFQHTDQVCPSRDRQQHEDPDIIVPNDVTEVLNDHMRL